MFIHFYIQKNKINLQFETFRNHGQFDFDLKIFKRKRYFLVFLVLKYLHKKKKNAKFNCNSILSFFFLKCNQNFYLYARIVVNPRDETLCENAVAQC